MFLCIATRKYKDKNIGTVCCLLALLLLGYQMDSGKDRQLQEEQQSGLFMALVCSLRNKLCSSHVMGHKDPSSECTSRSNHFFLNLILCTHLLWFMYNITLVEIDFQLALKFITEVLNHPVNLQLHCNYIFLWYSAGFKLK